MTGAAKGYAAAMSWPHRLIAGTIVLLVVLTLGFAVYKGLYWMFGGKEAARERGNAIVAEEQGKAAVGAAQTATNKVIERYEYHKEVDRVVVQGQQGVNNAWKGESVGKDVDAAGRAALCGLHDSFCGGAEAPQVQ